MSRRRPRLRTVLLLVNLLILLLPVGGIAVLRLYENELIRSTEAQLLAQGTLLREVFRIAYLRALARGAPPEGAPAISSSSDTAGFEPPEALLPRLDVSHDRILPPAPPAAPPTTPPDPAAVEAAASIAPALEVASLETLAGVRIVDRSGVVVASSGSEAGLSLAGREEVSRALRGERVSLLRRRVSEHLAPLASVSRGQRYRVFVALPVREGGGVFGAVVLSRTPLDIAKALYLNRRPMLLGAAGIALVVILVSTLTAVTIVRPARVLTELADRVARGERGAVLESAEPGTYEMARLSDAIATMARTLEDRADYIRTFASHVSHEFKTPLTTIRGTVELLRDHFATMTPEERERFVGILEESSDRLDRLVRRLLELARADVLAPGEGRTDLPRALARAAQAQREAGLDVTVEVGEGVETIRMSEETFDEIVSNLLENVRLHGGRGVKVRLGASLERAADGRQVVLAVADDGPGVSEANAVRLFTPFFTTARDRGGSGLGLSIVRSLLAAHGGTIRLARGSPGATFVLRIPAGD